MRAPLSGEPSRFLARRNTFRFSPSWTWRRTDPSNGPEACLDALRSIPVPAPAGAAATITRPAASSPATIPKRRIMDPPGRRSDQDTRRGLTRNSGRDQPHVEAVVEVDLDPGGAVGAGGDRRNDGSGHGVVAARRQLGHLQCPAPPVSAGPE